MDGATVPDADVVTPENMLENQPSPVPIVLNHELMFLLFFYLCLDDK